MEDITAELVAKGAAMLDSFTNNGTIPIDWRLRIDVGVLDIRSPRNCVVGQLFGDWHRAPLLVRNYPAFGGWLTETDNRFELILLRDLWIAYLTDANTDTVTAEAEA